MTLEYYKNNEVGVIVRNGWMGIYGMIIFLAILLEQLSLKYLFKFF